MFSFKTKKPAHPRVEQHPTSFIAAGTVLTGNIESSGDIRIDGCLKGNLNCRAKVVLGSDGVIEGDVRAGQADLMGKVDGRVWANELLNLRGSAEVTGDIHAVKLLIEPTASFNGQCKMGANVVELQMGTALQANG